jgi:hypothetical protein
MWWSPCALLVVVGWVSWWYSCGPLVVLCVGQGLDDKTAAAPYKIEDLAMK